MYINSMSTSPASDVCMPNLEKDVVGKRILIWYAGVPLHSSLMIPPEPLVSQQGLASTFRFTSEDKT